MFARSFGEAETDRANGAAADLHGNVFVCGATEPKRTGTVDPAGQALLLKYSPRGDRLWSQYADAWSDARACATDAAGNVVVTGKVNKRGGANTGYKYLTKYDGEGKLLWTKRSGGDAMAMDRHDNIVVAGVSDGERGTVDLVLRRKLYVAKLGPTGEHVWVVSMADQARTLAVTVDRAGDVYVAGVFSGNADFGGGVVGAEGPRDVFIVKRAGTDGRHLWSHTFRAEATSSVGGLAATANGRIVVGVSFRGELRLGGERLAAGGGGDIALAAFAAADGAPAWSYASGGRGHDSILALAAGRHGGVVVAGTCSGACGHDTRTRAYGHTDGFVASYSGSGKRLSFAPFGAPKSIVSARALVALDDGNVIVAGSYEPTLRLGARVLRSKGGADVFVTKLDE